MLLNLANEYGATPIPASGRPHIPIFCFDTSPDYHS